MEGILSLNPGQLREQIDFYTTTSTKDDGGGYPTSAKTFAYTMPCMLNPKGSIKSYEGMKTEYVEVWDLLMRWETGRVPSESMLAYFRGEYFNILGIENVLTRNLTLKLKIARK